MEPGDIKLPAFHRLLLEPLGVTELINIVPAWPDLEALPPGAGQPVMVIPGLTTGDWSTAIIRTWLKSKGFSVYGWDQGVNIKYTTDLEDRLARRTNDIADRHGMPVTLIGWSLGALTVRILARNHPDPVRQLISLGGPFMNLQGKTYVSWWYELLAGEKVSDFNPEWARAASSRPVHPSTSIYSRTDGMVSWQYCMDWETGPTTQNIEVNCNHLGFGMNPVVWHIVYDRLLQADNAWQPFDLARIPDLERKALFHV